MHHHCHPDTAAGVIEKPGVDKGPGSRREHKCDESFDSERSKQGREQRRQVPDAVQGAQDERGNDRSIGGLQARQGKSAPAGLFSDGGDDQPHDDTGQEGRQEQGGVGDQVSDRGASVQEAVGGQPDGKKDEQRQCVPLQPGPHLERAAQEASHAGPAFQDARHPESRQRRARE